MHYVGPRVMQTTFCMSVEVPAWHALPARTAKARHALKKRAVLQYAICADQPSEPTVGHQGGIRDTREASPPVRACDKALVMALRCWRPSLPRCPKLKPKIRLSG